MEASGVPFGVVSVAAEVSLACSEARSDFSVRLLPGRLPTESFRGVARSLLRGGGSLRVPWLIRGAGTRSLSVAP